jgi:methylase of polypeptide subunit release factors
MRTIRTCARAMCASSRAATLIASMAATPAFLHAGGWLLFEHGHEQGEAVRAILARAGFADVRTWQDWSARDRISGGRRPLEDDHDDE